MKIVPLGIAGFVPARGFETCTVLAISGDVAILFDAGTGTRRLCQPEIQKELTNVKELHVIFSHFHFDHIAGVTWLLRLWTRPLHFWCPGKEFVGHPGERTLSTIVDLPYFALPLRKWANVASINTFEVGAFTCGSQTVIPHAQPHNGGSAGFKLGRFSYLTDTDPACLPGSFVRDQSLVFLDSMYSAEEYAKLGKSTTHREHGAAASNAAWCLANGVQRFGLFHLDVLQPDSFRTMILLEARTVMDDCFIPNEGELIELD